MSNIFVHITENPQDTKRLLGIDYEQVQDLIKCAETLHLEKQAQQQKSQKRLIAKGGGRKPALSIPEQVILTLGYLRQHTTFQILGLMFNVSESTAHNIFHYWLGILQELLPESMFAQLENSKNDWEIIREVLADEELLIDSSEQDRERPTDDQEQERFYSGYKKTLLQKYVYNLAKRPRYY